MADYWKTLWQRLTAQNVKDKAEVERIAILQRLAVSRRTEYAEKKEQAALRGDAPPPTARTRMREAEAAHLAALQKWENKQSGQKSR